MVHSVVGAMRLAAAAVCMTACQQRGAVSLDRAAPAAVAIRVSDGPDGAASTRFALHDVNDLVIDVSQAMPTADVPGTQILEIYSPDGAVYREERGPAGRPMRCTLPVAGTSISRHGITGRWWAELRIEGKGPPIAEVEFEIAADPVAAE